MDAKSRVLVTGVDTRLGAAVREHFIAGGADTFGTYAAAGYAPVPDGPPEVYARPGAVEQAQDAVERAVAAMGGIDALVLAHGLPTVAPLTELSMTDFWQHVDSALTGSFLFAQAAATSMRDNNSGGRIVLTTSRWHIGGAGLSAVATAAGGIVALTKTLTRDFGRFGVGVNAVAVGAVDSEWSVCDASAPLPPTGAVGSVEQVAATIGLLCQRQLGAAVGQIVNVDGGLSRNRV
ncbi:SDR family NAD(P)-dependent oxidoreductase [Mycolicibacterium diernhoferi]|uniref:3-oxoacyl-[acyl-carrier-protein] reductase MabA n=1 Tax=Mycolicibacterium diernhoferi TaxID=1801 RepID=A0A1Q4H7B4_9MYCO|nr:SDR family oxidoreductase [Mycolicibacterium diernhoferi]OJZ63355.1 oxidoreductase [Mycolicibacterium diernhoferi]OPE56230.1 oxidoreductase [Mycolicibacterium diernhoferi]PEG54067.1 NAD(P)-dependent oxidoreductase [Mycolicibacterium diernhoferi]QYL20495.1 SDR family oxidoreductase [Mycolicibacterium diernhoferi]